MLDYPIHFPGSNMTAPWTRTGMSVAVVLVALTVLLLSCCGAAALFLVACCGSRRRDAVAESGDSRWLPGVGLIDYVPVSNRSSVRVSLIMSTGSQGAEQTPQGHRSPSADTLASVPRASPPTVTAASPTVTAASPSVLSDLSSIQVRPPSLAVYSARETGRVLLPSAGRKKGVHSAPTSPARSRPALPSSSVSSRALGPSVSSSGDVEGSRTSLPATLPSPTTNKTPSVESVSSSPSLAPAKPLTPPSPVRLKAASDSQSEQESWSTVPSQRPHSTDSPL